MGGKPATLFHEEQHFSAKYLRLIPAIPPALFVLADIWQVGLGHSIKPAGLSNAGLMGWRIFLWIVYLRLITVRLITEIRANELVGALAQNSSR